MSGAYRSTRGNAGDAKLHERQQRWLNGGQVELRVTINREKKKTPPSLRGQHEKQTILTESTPSLIFYYLNSVLDAYKYRLSLEKLSVKLYRHSKL